MSLTTDDITQIRGAIREEVRDIVREEVRNEVASQLIPVNQKLDEMNGRLEALENDVKEIYAMIARLQHAEHSKSSYKKLSLEEKLLKLNDELLSAAKQAGIELPR